MRFTTKAFIICATIVAIVATTLVFVLFPREKTPLTPVSAPLLPVASSSTTALSSTTSSTNPTVTASHPPCLADDEYADYPLDPASPVWTEIAKVPVVISARDKATDMQKFSFQIDNVPRATVQIELHRCHVYILREFQNGPMWSRELWRYDYSGQGAKLVVLLQAENDEIIKDGPHFSSIFHVDPSETYLALDRGSWADPDQAMFVKSLASSDLPDVLTVTGQDILSAKPELSQGRDAEPLGWSSDGKYLWGGSSGVDFSNIVFFRIANLNKNSIGVFGVPSDAVHVQAPRLDTGYLLYVYGPPFAGFADVAQQIYQEWKQAGKKEALYLYNLFTKQKTIVATSDDPSWLFDEYWLSDNQFQYTLPSSATTTYTIAQ